MGKPIGDSLGEVDLARRQCIAWYAEAVDKIYDEIAPTGPPGVADPDHARAVGVVGAVVPWNFPLLMPAGSSARRWPPATRWC